MMKRLFVIMAIVVAFPVVGQQSGQRRRAPTFAPTVPYWYTLEHGKKLLRERNYALALRDFEKARADRKDYWEMRRTAFVLLLSLREVRQLNDALPDVERYIKEHNQFDAATALEDVRWAVGDVALRKSAARALEILGALGGYPEAEFYIGEVYRIEGERQIAVAQYRKALEWPAEAAPAGWRVHVLYRIAAVNKAARNYNEMERTLSEIIAGDTLWNNKNAFARNAMARTLGDKGINKFLMMYRYRDSDAEEAHRILGRYYYRSGRYHLAETQLMFAALHASTVVIDEVRLGEYDFEFSNLADMFAALERRKDLREYLAGVGYSETLYYLGAALAANGKMEAARGIWGFLADRADTLEWGKRSARQLKEPFIEPIVAEP
jgi:tetratricopeptide (TPR) repeat protein